MSTTYYPHEIRRHNRAIKEVVQRACTIVFTEPKITFRLKHSLGSIWKPSEQVIIRVLQKIGFWQRKPICAIEINRPKTDDGRYAYQKASAVLLDGSQHAGNTRLLGHLQKNCPFLPPMEVTLTYDLQAHP